MAAGVVSYMLIYFRIMTHVRAYILDITMYKMHVSLCSYCTVMIFISEASYVPVKVKYYTIPPSQPRRLIDASGAICAKCDSVALSLRVPHVEV